MSSARHRRKGDRINPPRAGAAMTRQLELFVPEPPSPLVGQRIRLDRAVDRDKPCCRNVCEIAPAKGPHVRELFCADCGQHRAISGAAMIGRYSIMGRECGAEHAVEVCRVDTNPEQVATALKGKMRKVGRRLLNQYDLVYVEKWRP
jgi:hypothetical protein